MSTVNRSVKLAGELGSVLLEGKVAQPDAVAFMGVGLVCLTMGAGLVAWGWPGANAGVSFTLGLGVLMVLLGCVVGGAGFRTYWSNRGTRQFVHERGLREESRRGVTCIGFDDADELEYSVTDHYNHGVFVGSVDHFGLWTHGTPGREIVFNQKRRKREDPTPFPAIVETITARLAERFAEALARGESVGWTSKMRIHPDGLTLGDRPSAGRPGPAKSPGKQPSRVGWDSIDKIEVDEGFCRIRLKGSAAPKLTVTVGERNFHPGYRAVAGIIQERAASRPVAPVRGLAHGEKIVVEYPYSIDVRFGMERARFLVDEKAQKNAREIRLGLAVILPAAGAGLAVMAYFQGKIALSALQLRLAVCFLLGGAAYAAIEVWERLSTRRKVLGEAKVAKDRFESGKGPDPDYLYQVTLGPPGFSCRMPQGNLERPWSSISRVLWDKGSIIICRAGTAVERDALAVYIPAVAFDDPSRARDAFERISDWHKAAQNVAAAL